MIATAVVRRPYEMSSRTAPASSSAAERESRGSTALMIETAITACGSCQISRALENAARPAPLSPESRPAAVASWVITR